MNIWLKWSIGAVAGAAVGYTYWYFVGCNSGSCAITSSPVNSSIYGTFVGVWLASSFGGSKATEKKKSNDQQGNETV